MKRILMTTLAALLATSAADAGPLRNWLASRRHCQPCQQVQQVQYQPAPQCTQPTYTQPVQQVAYYQPDGFAPVMSGGCVNGVCPVK